MLACHHSVVTAQKQSQSHNKPTIEGVIAFLFAIFIMFFASCLFTNKRCLGTLYQLFWLKYLLGLGILSHLPEFCSPRCYTDISDLQFNAGSEWQVEGFCLQEYSR